LWNLNTGVVERTFEGHSGGIFTDQFSGDKIILAGSTDRTVKLWDLSSRDALLRTIARHDSEFLSLTFSPNGQYVVTSGANDPVRIWDVATGSELRRLPWLSVKSDAPVPKAFSRDGKILAGEDNNHHIELYDAASGVKLRTIETHGGGVYSIAFSLDGKILAVGGFKEVTLWDVASGRELLTLAGHANIVHAIVFSPDGKTLATDNLNQLFLWDVSTGTKLQTLKGGGGENFIFSPDSKTIFGSIVKFIDKVMMTGVMHWDVRTGAELRSFQGHSAGVNNIAFSPDAKTMATSSIDNSVKLWDLNTGKELHTLNGHSGQVLSVAFSADGRLLISSSDDLTIKIWTATSGEELATLIALDDQDWAVITPDGLFDGSPPAWDRIAWRYERKPFEVIVTPVEAYFTEFYYPGLLADIIAGKRPRAETNLESKDRRQLPVKLTVAEKTDPQTPVSSRTIRLRIEVEEAPKVLTSRVWWEAGARDVRLFRNGSLVKFWQGDLFDLTKKEGCILQPRQTGSEPQRSICTATVPIVAGPNNFTAYAFNHDNIKSEDATLTVTGADSLKHKGTLHILAVGVSQYANQEYNLNYTTDDATSFATQLKLEQEKQSRYQSVETKTLLNQNATKENILAELRKLAASVQPEDAVVVYFSGHGKASGDHFYLVPHDLGYDGSRDQLSAEGLKLILAHSISDLELEEVFRGIDAGQMFMIIDACNSGQALENKDEPRRGPMNTRGLAQLAYEKGMYIMTASQNVEEAFVSEKLKHSYLTFALVEEGLKTKAADANHNGEVTLREWFDYALARVPKLREEVLQTKSLEEVTPKMKAARSQKSQTPRVFYRRELDSNPLVVAVFATTAPQ
jgi:WD40 repeat protein